SADATQGCFRPQMHAQHIATRAFVNLTPHSAAIGRPTRRNVCRRPRPNSTGSVPARALAPDAAKAKMAGRGVDRLGVAGCGAVAAAITRRAEMRAALDRLARNLDPWLTRIVALLLARAPRIDGQGAR